MKGIAKKLAPFLLVLGACLDNTGDTLTLSNALVPTPPDCVLDPTSTNIRSSGVRDVTVGSLGARGYRQAFSIVNKGQPADAAPLAFGNRANVLANAMDVVVDGFNVCYEFKDFRTTTEVTGTTPEATFPSCKELRALDATQRTVFLSASTVIPAGTTGVAALDLFPRAINGVDPNEDFTASSSPFLRGLAVAGDRKTVIVHLQAVGHLNDNRRVESNEVLFPVNLCVGCVPFATACSATQHPDPNTLCFSGQDDIPDCVDN